MRTDKFGQVILNEADLCKIYMADPTRKLKRVLVDNIIQFSDELELNNKPGIQEYKDSDETIEEFDRRLQSDWLMPLEYKNLDIVEWVLNKCENQAQLQRAGQELLMYVDRDLIPLLQYLKYLVDTMRDNNIVWGVGRGSSVSSYVLFLIGVHRIDSLYYDLSIQEFLR